MSTRRPEARASSKLLAWTGTLGLFLAASGIQVLLYALVVTSENEVLPVPVVFLGTLCWLLVPASLALWLSLRFLRPVRATLDRHAALANLALLCLFPLSVWLGGVISINLWGS